MGAGGAVVSSGQITMWHLWASGPLGGRFCEPTPGRRARRNQEACAGYTLSLFWGWGLTRAELFLVRATPGQGWGLCCLSTSDAGICSAQGPLHVGGTEQAMMKRELCPVCPCKLCWAAAGLRKKAFIPVGSKELSPETGRDWPTLHSALASTAPLPMASRATFSSPTEAQAQRSPLCGPGAHMPPAAA